MGTRTTEVHGWKRLSLDFVAARPTYTGKLQGNQGDSIHGIGTLADLTVRIPRRRRWWTGIPGLGARKIEAFFAAHPTLTERARALVVTTRPDPIVPWDQIPTLGAAIDRDGPLGQADASEIRQGIQHPQQNDAADARAIWMATQMDSKKVAVKTEAQQAVLALHRMRQQLVKFRTMQINSLRGLLTEYGEVMGVGRAALDKSVVGVLERLSGRLPAILIDTLREQWRGLDDLDRQIG